MPTHEEEAVQVNSKGVRDGSRALACNSRATRTQNGTPRLALQARSSSDPPHGERGEQKMVLLVFSEQTENVGKR